MSATEEAMNVYRITTDSLPQDLHYLVQTHKGIIASADTITAPTDLKILQPDHKKEVKGLRRLGWEGVYFVGMLTTYSQTDAENFAYGWTQDDPLYRNRDQRLKEIVKGINDSANDFVGITTGLVVTQDRLDVKARPRFAEARDLRYPSPDTVYAAATSFRDRTAMISKAYEEMPEILTTDSEETRDLFGTSETKRDIIDPSLIHEEEWRLIEALHDRVRTVFEDSFRPH